jgi:site-specific DNA-methyltransferase (adenine-specific)
MGKGWDNAGVSFNKETWQKCLRVLKPGGYLLAFGGSRTFHRIAVAIEDAGFEIRDTIMWLYGSGFPKSMNIGLAIDKKNGVESEVVGTRKEHDIRNNNYANNDVSTKTFVREIKEAQNEWQGWGTALKPSFEPIIVARKPFKGSLVENVIEWGVGGLNIDECRVGNEVITQLQKDMTKYHGNKLGAGHHTQMTGITTQTIGRFPANTILTYDQISFDEVCGGFPNTKTGGGIKAPIKNINTNNATNFQHSKKYENVSYVSDSGSASRYFYCAKASKKDRDEGLNEFETKTKVFNGTSDKSSTDIKDVEQRFTTQAKNIHPTVKPTELMQYLVRLVTPNGGTVLDPFMGSGSTGKAVAYENKERNKDYKFIGIELNKEYCDIAKARIDYADRF